MLFSRLGGSGFQIHDRDHFKTILDKCEGIQGDMKYLGCYLCLPFDYIGMFIT